VGKRRAELIERTDDAVIVGTSAFGGITDGANVSLVVDRRCGRGDRVKRLVDSGACRADARHRIAAQATEEQRRRWPTSG